jgi:predicted nucleotidyltransferase
VSKPRTPSFGAKQRSRLARRAATARWARLGRGVLTLAQIRDAVTKALDERKAQVLGGHRAKAYLFDSYARGDATAADDIYIMVIEEFATSPDWLTETGKIREALYKHLGYEKSINVTLADEATYEEWKGAYGTPHYAVATEGIRIA